MAGKSLKIAEKMRVKRARMGMKLRALAKLAGCSHQTLSNWEERRPKSPRKKTFEGISKAYKIPIANLFVDKEEEEEYIRWAKINGREVPKPDIIPKTQKPLEYNSVIIDEHNELVKLQKEVIENLKSEIAILKADLAALNRRRLPGKS